MSTNKLPDTFSAILQAEKEMDYNITQKIVSSLAEKGIRISQRTVQLYCNGKLVPDYQRAKDVLKVLGIVYSESDLLSILNESRERLKEERSSSLSKTIFPDEMSILQSTLTFGVFANTLISS